MKFEAINKAYTAKVTEWLGKGYWINAGTMSGSQGEYAHVDLTNGKELIRVLMEDRTDHGDDGWDWDEKTVVVVGRVTEKDRVRIGSADRLGNTVWNNHLEELEVEEFFKIGRPHDGVQWYGTKEELKAQKAINKKRWESYNRLSSMTCEKQVLDLTRTAPIVHDFVRRQKGCKNVRLGEINKVTKVIRKSYITGEITGVSYEVEVRNKVFKLA